MRGGNYGQDVSCPVMRGITVAVISEGLTRRHFPSHWAFSSVCVTVIAEWECSDMWLATTRKAQCSTLPWCGLLDCCRLRLASGGRRLFDPLDAEPVVTRHPIDLINCSCFITFVFSNAYVINLTTLSL